MGPNGQVNPSVSTNVKMKTKQKNKNWGSIGIPIIVWKCSASSDLKSKYGGW